MGSTLYKKELVGWGGKRRDAVARGSAVGFELKEGGPLKSVAVKGNLSRHKRSSGKERKKV